MMSHHRYSVAACWHTGRVPLSFCRSLCPSVCRSVGNECVLWKNGWPDRDVVWNGGSGGPKERCIRWGSDDQAGKGQTFGGNWVAKCNVQREFGMSPAQMGKLGRWERRNRVLNWSPDLPWKRGAWEKFLCPLITITFFSALTMQQYICVLWENLSRIFPFRQYISTRQ